MKPPICIFGPTAAGKTALAIALAQRLDGVIINADAMQVYSGLHVITARPSAEEEAAAPHRLFGLIDPADPCNAVRWTALADTEIARAHRLEKRVIFVGGTGLYFRALLEGLDDIPAISPEIRAEVRALELPALREVLGVTVGDRQRLTRKLEVLRQTGRPLESFHSRRPDKVRAHKMITLLPPRDQLYARIDRRFELMLRGGEAQREVADLVARALPSTLPSMRAIGVPELAAVQAGSLSLAEATARAQQASRRYAKRQFTWARNQVDATLVLDELLSTSEAVTRAVDTLLNEL